MLGDIKWYYAKLGKANGYAEYLLTGNPCMVAVFFDSTDNIETWRDPGGRDGNQKRDFYFAQAEDTRKTAGIVVLFDTTVYLLKPVDKQARVLLDVNETRERFGDVGGNTAKLIEVEPACLNWKRSFKDVPHVVASMTANQALARSSFHNITDPGNQIALDWLIDPSRGASKFDQLEKQFKAALPFWCLSSVQMETLVAKLCEEAGCFVPAYRGGSMKDVDLFAYNYRATPIHIGEMTIEPNRGVSIQVKRGQAPCVLTANVDYLVGLFEESTNRCLGTKWLLNCLKDNQDTRKWLLRTLDWLPQSHSTLSLGSAY